MNISVAQSLGVQYRTNLNRDASPSLNLPGAGQLSKRHKREDPCRAAASSADLKPTHTHSDPEDISQTVLAKAAKYDAASAPAVHAVQLSIVLQPSARAVPERLLMCQDVSAANEEVRR